MKKLLSLIAIAIICLTYTQKINAMNYADAFEQIDKKPVMVLLYANWADDYQKYINNFRNTQTQLADRFNYVELDIASPEMKEFNKKYNLYTNLPYILMFRNDGKISAYIDRNCSLDANCIIPKAKSFIRE